MIISERDEMIWRERVQMINYQHARTKEPKHRRRYVPPMYGVDAIDFHRVTTIGEALRMLHKTDD